VGERLVTAHRAPTEADAAEALWRGGGDDGLPVVVPTPARVERMVLAAGLDGDVVLGEVGPGLGEATVEKVAVNAVLAGCTPDHLPVLVAAVRAVCDPRFDLSEVQATTHAVAPLLIVNGEARAACEMDSGWGALGPAGRGNVCVGRALRLVLRNLGGGTPGAVDMAVLGQPGKLGMCVAEAEEASPFPPLHVSLGFDPDTSVVTVIGTDGPHSVFCQVAPAPDGDRTRAEGLVDVLAAALASPATNNAYFGSQGGGGAVCVLNPMHAEVLATAGFDRSSLQQALWERARNPRDLLRRFNPDMVTDGPDGEELPALRSPEDTLVLVAGGRGYYSAVLPTWGRGAHCNVAVSQEVLLNEACAVPWMLDTRP
jgi:hypothetical protein